MEGDTLMETIKLNKAYRKEDVETFAEMMSMLNVSKYNDQKEWRSIVATCYWEVFIKEDDDE